MSKIKYLTGTITNAVLDKEIKDLRGIVANAHERAQVIAVGIISHDREHGDCSRARDLVNAIANREERNFMVQFLAYFGAIGCKMEKGVCTGVGHIDAKAKNYHKPNLDGAKANNWFEAYDETGKKADWFQGPPKPMFVPGTLGDVGDNILRFSDRLQKNLDETKDNGRGEKVPLFDLSDDDRKEVNAALNVLRKVGKRVMAREMISEAEAVIKETAAVFKLSGNADETTVEQTEGEPEQVAVGQ